ncbi:MAG: hypothetical protein JW969_08765 [Spirochaetales bacterium]|nr:hypothetical protein [Spirochaetales bacterium]
MIITKRKKLLVLFIVFSLAFASFINAAEWVCGVTYTAGTVVTYLGSSYEAIITHTAWCGANWNPADTPTLWKPVSGVTVAPTATSTATPTNTAAATATATNTMAATATGTNTNAATATPTRTSTPTPSSPATLQDITNLAGTITAQYYDSPANEEIDKLIDNTTSTKYLTFHASGWVQFQGPSAVVTQYTISSANDAAERDPYTWTLQGSTNGSTWVTLDSRSGEDFPNRFQTRTFSFSNGTSYSYYRLNMTNNSGTILQLSEWEIFGTTGTTNTATPTRTSTPSPTSPSYTSTPTTPVNLQDITNLTGTVSAQYYDSPTNEEIDKLIDNSTSTKYLTFHASGWVQFAGSNAVVTQYTISSANDAAERDPYTWTLQGSTNGSTWITLDSRSGEDFPNRFQTRTFSFNNGNSYSYYRLNMTNNSGTILQLSEWEIFGVVNNTATATPTQQQATSTSTPTRTPTPVQATATATRTPTATPVPTIPNTGLPKRIMVGYWHTWDSGNPFIPLAQVNSNWDVINIAFAVPVSAGSTNGQMTFSISSGDASYGDAEFRADIRTMQSRGKKIVLSIGGYEGYFSLTSSSAVSTFVNAIKGYISSYGFDGIDIDLEQSSVQFNSGADPDFANPTSPKVVNMISAISQIVNSYSSNFILSWAPETFYLQLGYQYYGGLNPYVDTRAGVWIPMIHALRSRTTYVHAQLYNSGAILGTDGQYYTMGNAASIVAMCKMVITGFNVNQDASHFFPGLRADQVVIGVPASASAAGSGQVSNSELQSAFTTINNSYSGLRGIMAWSINWDSYQNNNSFVISNRAYLNTLP